MMVYLLVYQFSRGRDIMKHRQPIKNFGGWFQEYLGGTPSDGVIVEAIPTTR